MCDVEGCEKENTWWTCAKCDSHTCHDHQIFTGITVPVCGVCYKEWLKKRHWSWEGQFDRYKSRQHHVGWKISNLIYCELVRER